MLAYEVWALDSKSEVSSKAVWEAVMASEATKWEKHSSNMHMDM